MRAADTFAGRQQFMEAAVVEDPRQPLARTGLIIAVVHG
jgi:hypothetical protein